MSSTHDFIVTVTDCTPEEADTVMSERLGFDEDYGFNYGLDWKRKPEAVEMEVVVENLKDALVWLEKARSHAELLGDRWLDSSLDNVSHFIQETFSALGMTMPDIQ